MKVVRGALRILALILSVGLGAGSALDACLVSCHPGAVKQNALTGHCHTVSGSESGSHVHAVPTCCHDGSSGLANRNDDGRAKVIAGSSLVLASISFDGRLDVRTKQFPLIAFPDALSISDPHVTPLRV
ncbi:MAG TPA: hypothetical protein VF456_00415 [Vicinamibacterales bacterium]